jgi:hypothetical protein
MDSLPAVKALKEKNKKGLEWIGGVGGDIEMIDLDAEKHERKFNHGEHV